MRFDCDARAKRRKMRDEEVREFFSQWLPWFAWRPVRLEGSSECCWLEMVERKFTFYDFGKFGWGGSARYRARQDNA